MIRIEFSNSYNKPIYIQVDPWACLYKLGKGERIEFLVNCIPHEQWFSIDEFDSENRILTLWNCDEFFIVHDGKQYHWEEYQSNVQ